MDSVDPDFEVAADYAAFTPSDEMKALVDTNELRKEEEMFRPRVEIWPDEWSDWVAYHETGRTSVICSLPAMKASPFCSLGYH